MILDYDFCAILISMILLIYFASSQKLSGFQNRVFVILVLDNFVTAAVDIIQYSNSFSSVGSNICSIVYLSTHVLIMPIIYVYILSISKSWYHLHIIPKFMIVAPAAALFILILINPFINYMFSYDAEGNYVRGSGYLLMHIITGYYIICIYALIFSLRKSMTRRQKWAVNISIIIVLLSMIIQFLNRELRMEMFAISYAQLIFFFGINNPFEQMDVFTNLYNKKAFSDKISQNILMGKRFGLIQIIIDNLTAISGDDDDEKQAEVILKIAGFLKSLEGEASVYRLDDNVLVAEFDEMHFEQLQITADHMEERFQDHFFINRKEVYIKARLCSISVPDQVNKDDSIYAILKNAEKAKDIPRLTATDFDIESLDRSFLVEKVLTKAIGEGGIGIQYKPVYSFSENAIMGAVANLYYECEEAGTISNFEIVDYAEKSGMYVKIAKQVFEKMLDDISEMGCENIDFIAMRYTGTECIKYNLIEDYYQLLKERNISPSKIVLLVSEYLVSRDSAGMKENMEKYEALGFRFGVLDFGSGFTDIETIYNLPINKIWLHRSIVADGCVNKNASEVLDSTLDLAGNLGIETMIDGVADIGEFEMLASMNCTYVMGSYLHEKSDYAELIKAAENKMTLAGGSI